MYFLTFQFHLLKPTIQSVFLIKKLVISQLEECLPATSGM